MKYTKGSIVSFVPDSDWYVMFTERDRNGEVQKWQERIAGWAIAVEEVALGDIHTTDMQAIVLDYGRPVSVMDYLLSMGYGEREAERVHVHFKHVDDLGGVDE